MPSTVRDSVEVLLGLGLATALDGWDIVTYRETGEYQADDVRPLYLGPDDPANAPDERVLLNTRVAIPVLDTRATVDVPINLVWRGEQGGDVLGGVNFVGLVRRRLDRWAGELGGIRVNRVRFQSGGATGRDSRRRPTASTTYLFRCRPASANT